MHWHFTLKKNDTQVRGKKYKAIPSSRFDLSILFTEIKDYWALLMWHRKVKELNAQALHQGTCLIVWCTLGRSSLFSVEVNPPTQRIREEKHLPCKSRWNALCWTIWYCWYWPFLPDKKNNFVLFNTRESEASIRRTVTFSTFSFLICLSRNSQ